MMERSTQSQLEQAIRNQKERAQNAAFLVAQKSFTASLADRIAALEFERKHATKAKQLIINREIGLIQAIAHDYEKQQQETL